VCRGLERIGVGEEFEYEYEYEYTNTNYHNHREHKDHIDFIVPTQALRNAILFQKDVIVVRKGSSVAERRGAVWVTD
jgi:hypothetical protein